MMNRKNRTVSVASAIALGGLLAVTLGLTGCSGEDEEPVAQERAAPPPPPPPPKPAVRSVEELRAELNIHDKVLMTEDVAPNTTAERRAILTFFDAFARGDDRALTPMLSDIEQRELERMVASGQWEKATASVDEIMIHQTGDSPNGKAVIAVYFTEGANQAQLWYYTGQGDEFTFEAAPTPPGIVNKLSGGDWIAAWHRILAEEQEIAMRPDEEIEQPQQVLNEGGGGSSGGSAPSRPRGPSMPSPGSPPRGPSGPQPPRRVPGGRPPG